MTRFVRLPLLGLLSLAAVSAAQGKQTFTGTITDSTCAQGGHSHMQMGPTDAECALACIDLHGAMFVLVDGKKVYALSDQTTSAKFIAHKVKVVGTLDAKTRTVLVDSITAAP